jgi:3-hydroxyisobutyrate dehydrogenase
MRAKLARNVMMYGCWRVAQEAASLAATGGVSATVLAEICEASDRGLSRSFGLLQADYITKAAASAKERMEGFVEKDLRTALELGGSLGMELPATRAAYERRREFLGIGDDGV